MSRLSQLLPDVVEKAEDALFLEYPQDRVAINGNLNADN